MGKQLRQNISHDYGATLSEYVIALTILLIIFLVAGIALEKAATVRGNYSMEVGRVSVPCAMGPLQGYSGGNPDACK